MDRVSKIGQWSEKTSRLLTWNDLIAEVRYPLINYGVVYAARATGSMACTLTSYIVRWESPVAD